MSEDSKAVALDLIMRLSKGDTDAESALFSRAGSGDAYAQRALSSIMLNCTDLGMLAAADAFARLCASNGDPSHRLYLAHVLATCATEQRQHDPAGAAEREAECLEILTDLADKGDEEAAQMIVLYADGFTPEGLAEGKRLAGLVTRPASPPSAPAPVIRVFVPAPFEGEDVSRSLRLRWWAADVCWSIRFYFSDLKLALGSLGRALIGRGL